MPLTMNDPGGPEGPESEGPAPLMHLPDAGKPLRTKIILAVFLVLVLASVVFLVYVFFDTSGSSSAPRSRATTKRSDSIAAPAVTPRDTARAQAVVPPAAKVERTQVLPTSPQTSSTGRYTIYIASYTQRTDADEEVQRWRDAGYDSFVVPALDHYRVALGHYAAVADARRAAAELEVAFENGYWIGPAGS